MSSNDEKAYHTVDEIVSTTQNLQQNIREKRFMENLEKTSEDFYEIFARNISIENQMPRLQEYFQLVAKRSRKGEKVNYSLLL